VTGAINGGKLVFFGDVEMAGVRIIEGFVQPPLDIFLGLTQVFLFLTH
jgi:hypothetical protein